MATLFAELTTTRSVQISAESIGMEEAQGNFSQQDESRGMNVHLDIEGTNSNGHGEERDENLNMVETIKNLQKDVQSHKDDNEKLMKAKEQQDDFNMKLLKGLNIIEKKLDKESGSRKSGNHKHSDEKRSTKSVSRHHHSPRHSNKRAGSNTSPSPVRNIRGLGWMSYEEK
jgi:hypothetical protein